MWLCGWWAAVQGKTCKLSTITLSFVTISSWEASCSVRLEDFSHWCSNDRCDFWPIWFSEFVACWKWFMMNSQLWRCKLPPTAEGLAALYCYSFFFRILLSTVISLLQHMFWLEHIKEAGVIFTSLLKYIVFFKKEHYLYAAYRILIIKL